MVSYPFAWRIRMKATIRGRVLVFLLSAIFATHARANYLLFDAVTDSVQIDGQTPGGGTFTYEAVVIFTPAYCGTGAVFTEWTPGYEHRILGVGTNQVTGYNYKRGFPYAFQLTNVVLGLYQPHHIAFVSERWEERIYVDGRLEGSRATNYSGGESGSNGGFLGGGVFGDGWIGYLDSIRISNNIRYTGSEFIPPLGDMTADGNTLLLYNFNEVPGSLTTADSSGNGRTGTLGMGYISGATSPEFVSKVPGPPTLSIMKQDGYRLGVSDLIPGWAHVLETSTSLTAGSWATNAAWIATGTQTNMPISTTGEKQFFRLLARP